MEIDLIFNFTTAAVLRGRDCGEAELPWDKLRAVAASYQGHSEYY